MGARGWCWNSGFEPPQLLYGALMNTMNWVQIYAGTGLGIASIDHLCVCPLYKPCLGRCPWPFIFLVSSLPTALRPPFCGTVTSAGPGSWSLVATVAMVVMVVMACGPGRLPAIDPRLLPWV